MLRLLLDTAKEPNLLALFVGKKILAKTQYDGGREAGTKLFQNLPRLLRKTKINFRDLQEIAVVTGPGSFTGVRVGVVAANTLALVLQLPLYALRQGENLSRAKKLKNFAEPFYERTPNITVSKMQVSK